MQDTSKLVLHYYRNDELHEIDAALRNKAEAEVLAIAKEVFLSMGMDVEIVNQVPIEGGFVELYKFIEDNATVIGLGVSVLTLVVTTLGVILTKPNAEMEKLKLENLKLEKEQRQLEIEKLKRSLRNQKELENPDAVVDDLVKYFQSDYKIIKRKSNFYQSIIKNQNITSIGTQAFDNKNKSIVKESKVSRTDFYQFVLLSDELPDMVVDNAVVEIISPVLKGKYQWKGVYQGESIGFTMKDEEYKSAILKGEVIFHSGFFIQCVLAMKRKIDDVGVVQIAGYIVDKVLGKFEGAKLIETEQGKVHKKKINELNKQGDLFGGSS